MDRAQQAHILKDLEQKMVVLVGPRQAGKTWLAKHIASLFERSLYLNYDQVSDRKIIQHQGWLDSTDLIIFDELHKMPDWKNYLKGVYDTKPAGLRILVTGSARLEVYDKLGDSLAGRYFRHRLLPISVAELKQIGEDKSHSVERLIERGGFPEPYLIPEALDAKRWRLQYINSLLSTDIFELDKIQNIKAMRLLFELLQHRVGSPISYQSLSEDLAISPMTVKKYIQALEMLFIIFRVTPFSKNIARSLLKEPKIYFFDTGLVQGKDEMGAKFENMMAVSLLKHVYAQEDYQAEPSGLYYLRTKEGQEVDFAITQNNNITQIIEAKLSDGKLSKSLLAFHQKYEFSSTQVVKNIKNEYQQAGVAVLSAESFLGSLLL